MASALHATKCPTSYNQHELHCTCSMLNELCFSSTEYNFPNQYLRTPYLPKEEPTFLQEPKIKTSSC